MSYFGNYFGPMTITGGGGTYAAAGDVRVGVDRGDGTLGTLVLPAMADVRTTVQFGAAGTQYTGTLVVPASNPPGPVFEYIAVFGGGATTLRVLQIGGLSTKHGDTRSDRGRMYGAVTRSGEVYTLDLYADMARTYKVLTGTTATLSRNFTLTAANASGMRGVARIDAFAADDDTIVCYPTFAVDEDVIHNEAHCAEMPGYDATYGLGFFHAMAARQLLGSDLPSVLPNLFGKDGLADIVPGTSIGAMPDLRKIANVDQLRVMQGTLTKAISAQQSEHVGQYAQLAKLAGERYAELLKRLQSATIEEQEEAAEQSANEMSIGISTWSRG